MKTEIFDADSDQYPCSYMNDNRVFSIGSRRSNVLCEMLEARTKT